MKLNQKVTSLKINHLFASKTVTGSFQLTLILPPRRHLLAVPVPIAV
ncbi:hypothetical protein [Mycoplasmopsis cynos]|nr:hypothetical protein [Mycoplasmopsis cynos]